MVGAVTFDAVTALLVRSAVVLTVVSQPVAAARLKVVVSTADVPLLFSTPFNASLSAAFRVIANAVALVAVTLGVVRVYEPAWPVIDSLETSMVSPLARLVPVTDKTPVLAS